MKCKLGDIANFKNGKKRPKEQGDIPVYGGNGILAYNSQKNFSDCISIGRVGAYCGNVFFVKGDCWISDNAIAAIPKDTVNMQFLYFLLKNLQLNKMRIGSGQPLLTQSILNSIEVDIPNIFEQKKIAHILSILDDKIDTNTAINKNLLQQSLYIFSKMITNNEKNGCIGDYCSIKSGFAFKSKWWQNSGVPVIKIGSITQDSINLLDCSYVSEDKISLAKDYVVTGGDLLIAMTGATIGKFAIVPKVNETILVNQRVGKFFLGSNPISKLPFIYCTLKQQEIFSEIINRGQGSAQPNISASNIMSIPCVIPSSENIDRFNKETSPMFELVINNQYENNILADIRDTLLPRLMSGEIDVGNIEL